MKKLVLAVGFLVAGVGATNLLACDGTKSSANHTAVSVQTTGSEGTSCTMDASNTACCKDGSKAHQTSAVDATPVIAVSNNTEAVTESKGSCSQNCNMGSAAAALAMGLGLIGAALFATKKL